MTKSCIDALPHIFIPVPGQPTKAFCQKCLVVGVIGTVVVDPTPPPIVDPPPVDGRPTVVFTPTGMDDTTPFQDWVNRQADNTIWDVRGVAAINSVGVVISGKKNVKLFSSAGGGFKAIGNVVYSTPYSTMLYGANLTDFAFSNLRLDGNNKKAQAIFAHHCLRPKIMNCEAFGIAYDSAGGPYAALKADDCIEPEIASNNVHDLSGVAGGSGVRGIWCGVGGEFSTRPHIHHNTVKNPGHSGIIVEGAGPNVHHNTVVGVTLQGTGYKFIARGEALDAIWDDNLVDDTLNGGIMIEGSGIFPPHIYIRRWLVKNVGGQGTTFGFVYIAGAQGTRNVEVSDNTLDNCKHISNINYGSTIKFSNNKILSGSNMIALENVCDNIVLTNSGNVELGNNVTNVIVDGIQVR